MSTRIGGPHKCNIHDFETDDTNEFNEHCLNTEGHYTTGVMTCDCGTEIILDKIPFQPIGKELKLQCPECFSKNQDLNKMINDQSFLNQQQVKGEQQPNV